MIESLHLRNIATYDHNGVLIKDLRKVNFIYGVNGSGKTTLTKLVSTPNEQPFKDCLLKWKNNLPLRALVYNKEFRDKNFGQGKMDGVFTLGQATKEQAALIEQKITDRKAFKEDFSKKTETLDKQKFLKLEREAAFKEAVWADIYKKHELEFKEAFAGYMVKENFKNNLLVEAGNISASPPAHETLKEKAKTIFGKAPVNITAISPIIYERLLEIETDAIWQKKIIGKADVDIAKLIQRLNINDWVNEGRKHIQTDSIVCPFCQESTITEDFRNQLNRYFDESFLADTKLVKTLMEEYIRQSANLVNLLEQVESAEKAKTSSKLDQEKFSAYLKTFSTQVIANQELLNNKIKEPSRGISLVSIKEQLDHLAELISAANKDIIRHNSIVSNFAKEKQDLVKQVWRYITDAHKITIQNHKTDQDNLQKAIAGIESAIHETTKKHNALSAEIKELSKTVTSVQPSIDKINTTLSSYGFHNFSIVASKTEANKYQIQRADGTIAESTMSEGEITFITFLYFLQLTKGSTVETSVAEERILVIDDPISSLDSNVLFVVSSLLKEIIKSIKADKGSIRQLILLTHNVYFHKEVSFIDGHHSPCKDTAYWMLRKTQRVTTIQPFEMKNPIQNSYELLWAELKNRAEHSGITIQNTMRRIIENYFRLLGKYGDDQIIKKFSSHEEQEICRSLICWINDGSHSMPDDLFIEHQADIIEKYFTVFEKIFDHMDHKAHFNMMMGNPAA
ncbi:AAA family ATPase [Mucilaginibacter glaciei]|uniref:AAA family ATPase n=1 Tax=Mucilaginibacter glaciei TaxID=2772109 RepID=A0A926NW42_9SPHI|nr:AAA family ATPase [Mucilaginibacter glaciei]MBD1395130.1 AAA family ATPase [Mucilaginibacter glaciei]